MRSIGRALPQNYYRQETLTGALGQEWGLTGEARARFERLHRAVGVRSRHLALPMEEYRGLDSFAKANEVWIELASDLGTAAVESALIQADLAPTEIDHLFFTTVTGIASPGIDAKLINRLEMRSDIKRTPLFGLGCVGGAAGLARAADYLRAFPTHSVLMVSVEICSLTLQVHDRSIANMIASGLFADGAAAVVLTGGAIANGAPAPRIIASQSMFFHDTEHLMGWRIRDTGFQVILSEGVPDLVRTKLRAGVDSFLDAHELSRRDISHWIAHTGGPKVLQAMASALELPADALARSWKSLAAVGNLSSASVLFVAADLLESKAAQPGEYGLLLSMGPGFCGELVLLQW
jgi:alkylresorcinol/alkylpyrone synthase